MTETNPDTMLVAEREREIRDKMAQLQAELDSLDDQKEVERKNHIADVAADVANCQYDAKEYVQELAKELGVRLVFGKKGAAKRKARLRYQLDGNPACTYAGGKMPRWMEEEIEKRGLGDMSATEFRVRFMQPM